jgi:hypothetical protein
MGRVIVATEKQLKNKAEKLKTKIESRRKELTVLQLLLEEALKLLAEFEIAKTTRFRRNRKFRIGETVRVTEGKDKGALGIVIAPRKPADEETVWVEIQKLKQALERKPVSASTLERLG